MKHYVYQNVFKTPFFHRKFLMRFDKTTDERTRFLRTISRNIFSAFFLQKCILKLPLRVHEMVLMLTCSMQISTAGRGVH